MPSAVAHFDTIALPELGGKEIRIRLVHLRAASHQVVHPFQIITILKFFAYNRAHVISLSLAQMVVPAKEIFTCRIKLSQRQIVPICIISRPYVEQAPACPLFGIAVAGIRLGKQHQGAVRIVYEKRLRLVQQSIRPAPPAGCERKQDDNK